MDNNIIYAKDKKIIFNNAVNNEIIFDFEEYNDICDALGIENEDIFDTIYNKFNIRDKKVIEEEFIFLFNYVIIDNMCEYILDNAVNDKEIYIDDMSFLSKKEDLSSIDKIADFENIYFNFVKCLEKLCIKYGYKITSISELPMSENIKNHKNIRYFFYYSKNEISELKKELKQALLEQEFISEHNLSDANRYAISIYIDENSLKDKNIYDYNEYLSAWCSIAYIKMIVKIHDFFVDYFGFDLEKGLKKDKLTLCLIDLFDYKIMPYPKGVKKSIEAGKQIFGKCFFITERPDMPNLDRDLIMVLQVKDIFNTVPSLFSL